LSVSFRVNIILKYEIIFRIRNFINTKQVSAFKFRIKSKSRRFSLNKGLLLLFKLLKLLLKFCMHFLVEPRRGSFYEFLEFSEISCEINNVINFDRVLKVNIFIFFKNKFIFVFVMIFKKWFKFSKVIELVCFLFIFAVFSLQFPSFTIFWLRNKCLSRGLLEVIIFILIEVRQGSTI
jgi:hypothetical protein